MQSILKLTGFLSAAIFVAMISSNHATACSPNKKYFKLALEQRVSRGDVVFIGRVISIRNSIVHIAVDEVIRGPKYSGVELHQGHGTDCQFVFSEGKRIFFAGTLSFGPTLEFEGEIPFEILPIVEKLRRGEELESVASDFFD